MLHKWLVANELFLVDIWSMRGGAVIVPFAAVVWVFAWSNGMIARFVSRPPIVWLGEISFALYLVQLSVIALFEPFVAKADLPVSVVMSVVIAISLALSALLFTVVEMPCRRALLELADRKPQDAARTMTSIPARLWNSGAGLGATIVILVALAVFGYEYQQTFKQGQRTNLAWAKTLADTDFRPATFEGEAILLGYDVQIDGGEVQISMLWRVIAGSQRARFIHLLDDDGKVIMQMPPESDLFRSAPADSIVLDNVTLNAARVPASATIGIGFFGKNMGIAMVDRGVRSMSGRRLEIARNKDGKLERILQPQNE
jgi:hypothetical protein